MNNYRPICNLPLLPKILEKIVLRQLLAQTETHNQFSVHQPVYRARHGTETALLSVVNDLLTALDEDKISVLLLLDLSAAFDTIDHDILLTRLDSSFGIRNTALSWFNSYLSERWQCVPVQDHKSPTTPPDCGVPQGSALGPVLFILYTTPLSHIIENHPVVQ